MVCCWVLATSGTCCALRFDQLRVAWRTSHVTHFLPFDSRKFGKLSISSDSPSWRTAAAGVACGDRPAAIVEIYVTPHCPVCAYSHEVAAMIRAEFPAVEVRMITLGTSGVIIPESVFATPTYLLNGQRWSLGNPSPGQVRATLAAALEA